MRAAAAALCVVVAHVICLGSGFVDFDDDTIFLENAAVRDGPILDLLAFDRPDWRPLRDLSHRLDWSLHGQDPLWAHAHNMFLLAIVVWLAARLFERLGLSARTAAVVATLGFVHPVQVESIAWVSGRKELLAGVCFFALLHAFWSWLGGRKIALLGVVAAFVLGVMAKGHILTAPAVLLAVGTYAVLRGSARWRQLVEPVFATGALAAALVPLVMRGGVLLPGGLTGDQFTVTYGDQLQIPLRYAVNLLWPIELTHIYLTPRLDQSHTVWTVVSILALIIGLFAIARGLIRRRPIAALAAVPLVLLLPYLHLRPGSVYMADRYLFLVVPFVVFLVAHLRVELSSSIRRGAVISIGAAWVLVGLQHHQAWRDSTALWTRMTEVYPQSDWGYGRLGIALYNQGDFSAAGGAFIEASRRAPQREVHRQNAAAAMAAAGRGEAAAAVLDVPLKGRASP